MNKIKVFEVVNQIDSDAGIWQSANDHISKRHLCLNRN